MFSLSVEQAVEIWSELEQAYFQSNKYAGDTAEIYAYRLLPLGGQGEMRLDRAKKAAANLRELLTKFIDYRGVVLEVDEEWFDTEKPLQPFDHRVHVRVLHLTSTPSKRAKKRFDAWVERKLQESR